MSNNIVHTQDFQSVLRQIQQTRTRVFEQANTALIDLYWYIGGTISQRVLASFERTKLSNPKLSAVLRELHPTIGNHFKNSYVLEFLGLPEVHMPDKKLLQTKLHALCVNAEATDEQ
jgi:predicted nuclease of restriction endonuclease-like (RecB) superfamily